MSSSTDFTNKVAENYEKYMGPFFFEPYAKDLVERLPSNAGAILEIAAGTGQVTRLLRDKCPGAKIIATDLNPGMIETAKTTVKKEDKVEWMIADAQQLPFEDNIFDAVVFQFGLMFVPDKQKAVNEAYRVLKPGGKFIFNTWDKIQNNEIYITANDTTNSFFENDPITFWNVPFSMYDPDEMIKLMSGAGFNNTKTQNVTMTGICPSAIDAAKALTLGTPMYSFIAERNAEKIPAILDKVTEAFKKEFGEGSIRTPLSAWVTEGTK